MELYDDFKVSVTTIGSTRYKQVDWSPILTGVFVKTALDGKYARFRQIAYFFGEDASVQASRFVSHRVNS